MARLARVFVSLVIGVTALAAALGTGAAQVAGSVVVDLEPVGGSSVSGSAVLAAAGDGTFVDLGARGLTPGATYTASMHAGSCAQPSASSAALPSLVGGADGTASASGDVLFRGTDPVALSTMTDGEHVIVISGESGAVACGVFPALVVTPAVTGNAGLAGSRGGLPLALGLLGLAAAVAVALGARRLTARRSR